MVIGVVIKTGLKQFLWFWFSDMKSIVDMLCEVSMLLDIDVDILM